MLRCNVCTEHTVCKQKVVQYGNFFAKKANCVLTLGCVYGIIFYTTYYVHFRESAKNAFQTTENLHIQNKEFSQMEEDIVNQSKLLQLTLAKATEFCTEYSGSMDNNFFVLGLLTLASEGGDQPEHDFNKIGEEGELDAVVKAIASLDIIIKDAIAFLKDKLQAHQQADIDYIVFSKNKIEAMGKVRKEGLSILRLDALLNIVLSDPSQIIKEMLTKCSIKTPSGTDGQPATGDGTDEDFVESMYKKMFPPQDGTQPKKSVKSIFDEIFAGTASGDSAPDSSDSTATQPKVEVCEIDKISADAKRIQDELLSKVFGQDHAVSTFVAGYFQSQVMAIANAKNRSPRATFLFAGPPGTGKTFLAEQAAEALKLPFKRFDMSEYSDKEANLEFCGSDKVYKNGQEGNVTSFVARNPKCVLLFDEVEKSHLNIIHLFLQMLDVGRLRDNYTDEEVSFTETIVIFTTNAGKGLYDDPTITNLSNLSRKSILKGLQSDVNPVTGGPLFPAAICSRFAAGNVIMFNRMDANNLLTIVDNELKKHANLVGKKLGKKIKLDDKTSYALMFSEGAKADARTVKGKANTFFYQELYELYRLLSAESNYSDKTLKNIEFKVELPSDQDIRKMFVQDEEQTVLVFTDKQNHTKIKKKVEGVNLLYVDSLEEAKKVLAEQEIALILCDVKYGMMDKRHASLNLEDLDSIGLDFFHYISEYTGVPYYVLEQKDGDISEESKMSFARAGARGVIALEQTRGYSFTKKLKAQCDAVYQQKSLLELARANKVLTFKTAQELSEDGENATITIFDFKLTLALDADENKNILSNVTRPNIRFDEVIGAEDAKSELKYFVEFLKNPKKFLHNGVKAPKGILLYGPPGTGKTLLAKAMAGESNVTFITAEGNQFLKKYVGEGSQLVHDMFNLARKYAPAILFVDEIDAIGKNRMGESAEHTGDILTSFLTEMDGFHVDKDRPVFVLAATNYEVDQNSARSLDPALMRRFDRKILIDLPNKEERARYIRLKMSKSKNLQLSDEQIDNTATRSSGMSLAELELIIEFALRNAIKAKDFVVNDAIFEESFEEYNSGAEKKWEQNSLLRTARHEAGHAFLCWLSGEKPSYLTIVARANHGGYMQHGDTEKKGVYTKKDLIANIRTSLGGRAAELVYYGSEDGVSTGPSSDLESATRTAQRMICTYGMDEKLGLATIDLDHLSGAEKVEIRTRVNEILSQELAYTQDIISKNRDLMDKLVAELMEKTHLKGDEIDAILSSMPIVE